MSKSLLKNGCKFRSFRETFTPSGNLFGGCYRKQLSEYPTDLHSFLSKHVPRNDNGVSRAWNTWLFEAIQNEWVLQQYEASFPEAKFAVESTIKSTAESTDTTDKTINKSMFMSTHEADIKGNGMDTSDDKIDKSEHDVEVKFDAFDASKLAKSLPWNDVPNLTERLRSIHT